MRQAPEVKRPQANSPLVRRLTLIIAGVVAAASLLLGALGLLFEWRSVNHGFDQQLMSIAGVTALQMDGDAFERITKPADAEGAEYKRMSAYLRRVLEDQGLLYSYTVRLVDGVPHLVVDGSVELEEVGTEYPVEEALIRLYETGKPVATDIRLEDEYGWLKTGYAPIFNRQGQVVGAVGADLNADVIAARLLQDSLIYLGLWLLVTGAAFYFGRRAAQTIAARVTPLSAVARALAEGDLSASFADGQMPKKRDEVDELKLSLQAMQSNLSHLVADLRTTAGQVVGASREMAGAITQVSEITRQADEAMAQVAAGTHEQAGNAGEAATFFAQFSQGLRAVMEAADQQGRIAAQAAEEAAEIARVTEQIVAVARSAATEAAETNRAARTGSLAVTETAAAVEQIAGAVHEVSAGMERLSSRTGQIGEISGTIRELADQSNLLALNASIEAARAGEHGRGFAVVADEVRKLAVRSAQSADQISQILTAVRTEIDATLSEMQDGLQALSLGSEKAGRAREALNAIEASARRTSEQIERVAADSERNAAVARTIGVKAREAARRVLESAEGARELADGSHKAQEAVQSVAAISEETAALAGTTQRLMGEVARATASVQTSAESLSGVARELESATARFHN